MTSGVRLLVYMGVQKLKATCDYLCKYLCKSKVSKVENIGMLSIVQKFSNQFCEFIQICAKMITPELENNFVSLSKSVRKI